MAIFFNTRLLIPIYYVGIIFMLLSVSSSFYSFVGGSLSDRIGRRSTLLLGSALGAFIYLLVAFMVLGSVNYLLIVAAFILSSVSGAFVFPSSSALVADVTSVEERNSAYSLYRVMSNVGWAVGPIIGGFISVINVGYIFALMSATSLAQFSVILLVLKKTPASAPSKRRGIALDWKIGLFASATFFVILVSSQFSVTLPVYSTSAIGILNQQLGYIYAVNGAVVVLGQYPMTWITRKLNTVHVIIIGSLFYSFGYLLVGYSTSLLGLMFDMIFITVGENLTSPGMNTVVSRIAPEGKVGRYMGFLSAANSAGRAVGPSVGSIFLFLYAYNGPEVWGSIASIGSVSIALLIIFFLTVYRKYA